MKDHRDHPISGATGVSRDAFELALSSFLSWRSDWESHLEGALCQSPQFTMAHVLRAYSGLLSRDPRRVRVARAAHEQAAGLPANSRERLHLAALAAALGDNFDMCSVLLDEILQQYPRDILALHAGHAVDYLTGDQKRMAARVASVLPAWSAEVPGYHSLLAMHAFSSVECASYARAEQLGRQALQLNPWDVRAHHAVAHVFEMTDAAAAGARWMHERSSFWAADSLAATHCWWHAALFQLTLGALDGALELYDQRVRAGRSGELADLIDASALLWRIELQGGATGTRWLELASAWTPYSRDGYCSFSDLHAMLAFVGAQDWRSATRLEAELLRRRELTSRYGETTRLIGLPACRGILAYGREDYLRTIELLSAIPAFARRMGGSHAQQDVLYLTLVEAARRARRPPRGIAAA